MSETEWVSEDISDLTKQLKDEERRPVINWFTVDNQDSVFANDNSPRRIDNICGVAFCLEGHADFTSDGRRFRIKKGDMFAIFPHSVMQALERSDDFECKVLFVDSSVKKAIDISAAMKIFLFINEHPCASPTPEEGEALRSYMHSLNLLMKRPNHFYLKEIAERLIIAFAYEVAAIYQRGSTIEKEKRTRQEYLFYEFMELLTENYTTERRVEFYADKLCITPKYFSSIVKSVSGKSAAEWITDMVIRNAIALLTGTRQTIQQISNTLNFPNPSFFSQYFKRATGKTPKEYRRSGR